jgi:hypothetical protein
MQENLRFPLPTQFRQRRMTEPLGEADGGYQCLLTGARPRLARNKIHEILLDNLRCESPSPP